MTEELLWLRPVVHAEVVLETPNRGDFLVYVAIQEVIRNRRTKLGYKVGGVKIYRVRAGYSTGGDPEEGPPTVYSFMGCFFEDAGSVTNYMIAAAYEMDRLMEPPAYHLHGPKGRALTGGDLPGFSSESMFPFLLWKLGEPVMQDEFGKNERPNPNRPWNYRSV